MLLHPMILAIMASCDVMQLSVRSVDGISYIELATYSYIDGSQRYVEFILGTYISIF